MACFAMGHLDLHHVIKRSQGGADTIENLIPLCRPCHNATDYPSGKDQRLVIQRGTGFFTFGWA